MNLVTILVVVLVLVVLFGGGGYYGHVSGWRPAYYGGGIGLGGLVLLLVVLWLLGVFR
jgi:hypothetical protein